MDFPIYVLYFQVGLRKLKGAAGKNPENARSGGGGAGKGGGTGDAGGGGLDPYDLIDPVDLLALLPKTEFSTKIAEQKWSEKVEKNIHRNVFAALSTPTFISMKELSLAQSLWHCMPSLASQSDLQGVLRHIHLYYRWQGSK